MGNPQDLIAQAVDQTRASLVGPGDWLTGQQRRAAALEVRDSRTNELDQQRRKAISPLAVEGNHAATADLPAEAIEVLHRVGSDPGRLTRAWAEKMMAVLGEETYTELVGIAACTSTLDMLAWATFDEDAILTEPDAGDPERVRPEDVGDVGAWVSQSIGTGMANVSRSLSLVPVTGGVWVSLVQALYSRGAEFLDIEWDRALSRPQVELVAARTTAELECFY